MKNLIQLRSIIVLFLSAFGLSQANAAAPTWTVNPAAFQYNMTMMAVVNVNCTELQNPSSMVGVFVGSECRGKALTSEVINGRYLASVFVYSNIVSGEKISIKVYNASNDSIYDAKNEILFQQNASYGNASTPFLIYTNNSPTDILLSENKVRENASLNSLIGTLSASDLDAGETFSYSLASGEGDKDNAHFRITANQLLLAASVDFSLQSTCTIRVRTTDSKGCQFDKVLSLSVISKTILPANNFISPNGDGINDYFMVEDIDSYKEYALTIYNEQGLEVFSVDSNYRNNWGGTYDGNNLPTGAYSYLFKNTSGTVYKGIINLVKSN